MPNYCCGSLSVYFSGSDLMANCDGCGQLFIGLFPRSGQSVEWRKAYTIKGGFSYEGQGNGSGVRCGSERGQR